MAPLSNEVRDFLREYYEATGPTREECPRCKNTAFVHRAWVADSSPRADEEILNSKDIASFNAMLPKLSPAELITIAEIEKHAGRPDLVARVGSFARSLLP